MRLIQAAFVFAGLALTASGDNITFLADTGVFGPPLEVVHAYYNEWPTGACSVINVVLLHEALLTLL